MRTIIKTSQISQNNIFIKYKSKRHFIDNKTDKLFEKKYMKFSRIIDIIALSNEEFCEQLIKDYIEYDKIINRPFVNIMKDFKNDIISIKNIKDIDKIKKICDIMKLLLLGTQENITMALLLYEVAKKHNLDNNIGFSELMNYNLDYILMNNVKKLATIDEYEPINDLDFKKQLILNKNIPNYVKQLALVKIDEMKIHTSDYYKQLLYVDTLINFPWISLSDNSLL